MNQDIGKIVRRLRLEKNMTQEQLAEGIDISVTYVSMIENGRANDISLSIVCDLARVLGVSVAYLIGESTEIEQMDEEIARKFAECTAAEKRKVLKIMDIIKEA